MFKNNPLFFLRIHIFHNKTEVYLPFGAGTPLISLARLELQRSIGRRTSVELYFVNVYMAVEDGIDGKARKRFDAGLLLDVLAVGDDRCQTDVQFVGYLLVG